MSSSTSTISMESLENNKAFYDKVSGNYNEILEKETSNKIIRERVRQKFVSIVKGKRVLDFGGGTGLDVQWLLAHQYSVVFCEISDGMRNKAIAQHKDSSVLFLDNNQVDFRTWNQTAPFEGEVAGILSDFAVINCIEDISLLFNNLSNLLQQGGHLIALVLNRGYKKNRLWKLRNSIKSVISQKTDVVNVDYEGHKQVVYVYSIKELKKASGLFFDLCSTENLGEFILLDLVKK